jgi:opacity protein-like surface antigen/outer membrane receptor protein involved in Fe transport
MSNRKRRLLLLSSSSLLLLSCWAGAAVSQPQERQQDRQPEQPQSTAPAPSPPAAEPPAAAPGATPAPPQPAEQPSPPPTSPGELTIPPVTVTAPPTPTPVRTPPRAQPATTVQPAPAPRVPAASGTPARTARPSAPSAPAQSATERFDSERNNIFTPVGTSPTTLTRENIEALPQGTNTPFTQVLLQLPGVTQDSAASGNLHVRNEHANVSYRINGILLPDGLGAFGQVLDASFVGSLTLITGALPAQYGLRTAGIVDITTASFDNVGQIGFYGGSRQTGNSSIQYGGKTGNTEYFFTGRYVENILGIENPRPSINAVHDSSSQDRGFAYFSTIIDPTTRISFIGGTSINNFQIPNTPGVIPSFTAYGNTNFDSSQLNEVQTEKYKFGVLALQKSVADVDLQLAYFTRTSSIQFTPDLLGDLMFNGVATSVFRGSVVNGIQGDSAFRLNDAHTLRAGVFVSAEKTTVSGVSQLLPIDSTTGSQILPDIPFSAIDTSALLGWLGGVYLQDEWRITDKLTLNAGARFDQMWQYQDANQLSPRVSLTYNPFENTTLHAGFARTFTPPVQVIAAPTNTALFTTCPPPLPATCTTIQAPSVPPPYYPMQPERANIYDIGVVQKVLPGLEVSLDTYLKTARNLIDDGQFGAAYVLEGFNYDKAINTGVELKASYKNGNFQAYANWAWANQRATNVSTNQYLFGPDELAYIQNNWIYTDHTQIWTGSGGVSYLWNGTRLSADLIYGSGLRSGFANTDHGAPYAQVNTGMARDYYIPGWSPITLRFDVVNLFDVSYAIRNGTGIGVFAPQYGPRRGFYLGLAQKFGPGANKPPATPPYVPWISQHPAVWTWAGVYIGGNFGYGTSRFGTDLLYADGFGNTLSATRFSVKHDGAIGGGQLGYNWQYGMWLAGLEADMTFQHYRTATVSQCLGAICNPTVAGIDAPVSVMGQHNLDWFGTVRGRLGVAITPDLLVYGTGGLAYGEIEHAGLIWGSDGMLTNDAASTYANRALRAGWVAGGGIEARIAGNVTGRIEYLHTDFGFDRAQALLTSNATPVAVDFNSRIAEDLVRVGLNYKFDPYLAPYAPAGASALPRRAPSRMIYKAPLATVWTWTGFYFGVNAGYTAGKFDAETLLSDDSLGTPLLATAGSSKLNGAIGGAQVGYNWQAGMWIAGLEADAQFSTQRIITTTQCDGAICNPGVTGFDAPVTVAHSFNLDGFATLRGRLGALFTPDAVAYVTGGLAIGGVAHTVDIGGVSLDANGNPVSAPTNFVSRTAKAGWTVGGGLEARLIGNVTGKIEYLHMDFGSDSAAGRNNQNVLPVAVTVNSRVSDDIVRLGLNYKFDPNAAAPSAAKSVLPDKLPRIVKAQIVLPWTWAGYYIGISGGYSSGKARTDAFFNDSTIAGATFATTSSYNLRGDVFGLQTGYNFALGAWVLGLEGDLQLSGQRANPTFVCPGTNCNPAGTVTAAFDQNQKLEWFGTLRVRFGAAVTPGALVYVTGGAAIAGLITSGTVFGFDLNSNPITNPFSYVTVNPGWTVGGGVEARLIGNWTGKIEYLYLDFGSMTTSINNQGVMTLTASFNSHTADNLVRAGINYKFD